VVESLLLALIGGAPGAGLGVGLARAILSIVPGGILRRTTPYGVAALDYFVILAVGLIRFGTALFASYWPARRAALTDPVAALRTQ